MSHYLNILGKILLCIEILYNCRLANYMIRILSRKTEISNESISNSGISIARLLRKLKWRVFRKYHITHMYGLALGNLSWKLYNHVLYRVWTTSCTVFTTSCTDFEPHIVRKRRDEISKLPPPSVSYKCSHLLLRMFFDSYFWAKLIS